VQQLVLVFEPSLIGRLIQHQIVAWISFLDPIVPLSGMHFAAARPIGQSPRLMCCSNIACAFLFVFVMSRYFLSIFWTIFLALIFGFARSLVVCAPI